MKVIVEIIRNGKRVDAYQLDICRRKGVTPVIYVHLDHRVTEVKGA